MANTLGHVTFEKSQSGDFSRRVCNGSQCLDRAVSRKSAARSIVVLVSVFAISDAHESSQLRPRDVPDHVENASSHVANASSHVTILRDLPSGITSWEL